MGAAGSNRPRERPPASVQFPNSANIGTEPSSCCFNKILAKNDGTSHAFTTGMLHHAKSENARQVTVTRQSPVRNALKAACMVFLLGSFAPAQVLGGSLGRNAAMPGYATVSSAVATVNLSAVLPASVGISVSDVPLLVSVRDPGTPTDVIRVSVSSFWHLGASSTGVELVGFFDSPQQALLDAAGHAIPSTRVQGAINGGTAAPFSESSNVGSLGGSRTLYRQSVSRENFTGSRQDVVEISVAQVSDLGVPSGTYAGTLHLRIVAY